VKYKQFIAGILVGIILGIGTVFADTQTIEVFFNNIQVSINGEVLELKDATGKAVQPFIYAGSTYLPVRAVAEALGMEVKFNETTNTVEMASMIETELNTDMQFDFGEEIEMLPEEPIKYTPDGIEARLYNGKYTVSLNRFKLKYKDTEYKLSPSSDRNGYSITKNGEIIIDNILLIEGTYFLDYDYYCDVILPLLQ
jgi:hypothetical protein